MSVKLRFNSQIYYLQETGHCGKYCYIVDGEVKLALKEGEEYENPDDPCEIHRCTVSCYHIKMVFVCFVHVYKYVYTSK